MIGLEDDGDRGKGDKDVAVQWLEVLLSSVVACPSLCFQCSFYLLYKSF